MAPPCRPAPRPRVPHRAQPEPVATSASRGQPHQTHPALRRNREACAMNISALFIRRPVATILIAVAMVVVGGLAYFQLPVAALPDVEFPVIAVSASLPGAAPAAMATSVATTLIQQFTQIPAITSISATSSQGSTSIVLQFDLNRNIAQAAADVQAAIARTLRQLPANMSTPPSYRKINPADSPIMLGALQSGTQTLTQLA